MVFDFAYDPQGNVVQRQTAGDYAAGAAAFDETFYEGYGALRQDYSVRAGGGTPAHHDPAGFGGQSGYYTDTETGLLLLGHRYYDPGTGKFINRDPIGYQGGANLYAFCGGNPVNESDPDGTDVYILSYAHGDVLDQAIGTHAGIAVDWPGATPKEYDFGPAEEHSTAFYVKGGTSHGEVLETVGFNLNHPVTASHPLDRELPDDIIRVHTTPAQDKAIRKWLISTEADDSNNWHGAYGRYDGVTHQCSSYVNEALKAGGIDTGLGKDPTPPIVNIFSALEGVEGMYSNSMRETYYSAVKPLELRAWALMQPGASVMWHKK